MDIGSANGSKYFLPNYKLGKTLGIGSFGKVKIAEHKLTGYEVAIKILNRQKIKSKDMEEKAHRDLKLENLLLDSELNVKIADFGLSNIMPEGHLLKTSCGSPHYVAPEVISGKLYSGSEVDVWSCGVILYALLCGNLPFEDRYMPILFKIIKGGMYTLPKHLSASARDLISRMLIVNPVKRITIPGIRMHPWFQAHLPPPEPDTTQQTKKIDEEVIQEVINMGFDRNNLIHSLHNRFQNEGTVAYYLLLDNPRGYLDADDLGLVTSVCSL